MLTNIQLLRGIAAYFVVVLHSVQDLALRGVPVPADRFNGAIGIHIFFVISGFIMMRSTSEKHYTPTQFLANRVIRIVPLYWFATLLLAALCALAPFLFKSTTVTLDFLLKSLFFVPYARPNGVVEPILYVGWTLNYEMFFYAVFGVMLSLPRPWSAIATLAILAALATIGLIFHPTSLLPRFYTDTVILEFGYGMLLWFLWAKSGFRAFLRPPSNRVAIGVTVLAWLGLLALLAFVSLPPVPQGILAFVAVALTLRLPIPAGRVGQVSLFAGEISYAVYILHPFVINAVNVAMLKAGLLNQTTAIAAVILHIIGVTVIASLAPAFIDHPVRRFLKSSRLYRNLMEGSGSPTAPRNLSELRE